MAEVTRLQSIVSADTQQYESAMRRVSSSSKAAANDVRQAGRSATELDRLGASAGKSASGVDQLSSSASALKSTLSVAAIAAAGAAIVRFGLDALQSANNLQKTEATVRALSGSTARYNELVKIAAAGQRAYGGTLAESIGGLGQLVNLSNRTSVELTKLDNVSRRLAVVDPLQGIEGANLALKEFLTGSDATAILSLVRRFELPRSALRALTDEGLTAEQKLAGLDAELNKLGISNEVLTNRANTTAASYDRLGSAFDNAKVKLGGFLAEAGKDAAEGLTGIFDLLSGNATAGTQEQLIAGFEALRNASGVYAPLSEGEEQFAAAMLGRLGVQNEAQGASERSATIDASYAAGQAALSDALNRGSITAQQYNEAVLNLAQQKQNLISATDAEAAATDEAANSSRLITAATTEELQKKLENELATRELTNLQNDLARMGPGVAGGLYTAGAAAEALALRYNLATDEALALINAQARLAAGSGEARLAGQKAQTRNVQGAENARAPGSNATRGATDADINKVVALQKAQQDAAEAQEKYQYATAGSAGQLKILKAELQNLDSSSAKYWETLTKIEQMENKAAKAGGSRLAAESKTAQQIVQIAENTAKQLEEIDRRTAEQREASYRALAGAILTTAADLVAEQERNDLELVGASAENADKLIAREQAEAEARISMANAVSEARRMAEEGNAELAQEVLDQRTDQIAKQQSLDEEYANRQAELAGDPAATEALKTQYDEATAAIAEATSIRIELATAAAENAKTKAAEEKQAIVDAGIAQAAALGRTKDATMSAADAVSTYIGILGNIPKNIETVVTVTTKGSESSGTTSSGGDSGGGGGSSVKAAGGGQFLTRGITRITAGDNPGGVELVTVTPISGRGTTTVSGNVMRMAGGGAALVGDAARRAEDILKGGTIPQIGPRAGSGGGSGGGAMSAVVDMYAALLELEKEYLSKRKELNDREFQVNLASDLGKRQAEREMKRRQDEIERALDIEQDARTEELIAQARQQVAQRKAADLASLEGQATEERNRALAGAATRYTAQATKIAEEGARSNNEVAQFWATAKIADLQASYQEERGVINSAYDQRIAEVGERVEAQAGEWEDAATDAAKAQAEAEFQGRRDAMDDQFYVERELFQYAYKEREDLTKAYLDRESDLIKKAYEERFKAIPGGEDAWKYVQRGLGSSGAPLDAAQPNSTMPVIAMGTGPLALTTGMGMTGPTAGQQLTINLDITATGSTATDLAAVRRAGYEGAKKALDEAGQRGYRLTLMGGI